MLSAQWEMTKIRAEAFKNVKKALAPDNLLPHKLLNLGQTHRVDEWIRTAIVFFVVRKEPMGPNDAEIIGMENAFKIASLRECCQCIGTQWGNLDPEIILLEERPELVGDIFDTKRIEQLFGIQ